jgi:hypothetical protein
MSIKKIVRKADYTNVKFVEMGDGNVALLLGEQLLKPSDHLQDEKTQTVCRATDFVEETLKDLDNPTRLAFSRGLPEVV